MLEHIARFNSEALQVEGYTDEGALMAIVNSLNDKRFLRSLEKKKKSNILHRAYHSGLEVYESAKELL